MKTFKQGDKLGNGAIVIAFRSRDDKHVVLADWEGHHRYVTWRTDAQGNTFLGHYFHDLTSAYHDFDVR